MHINIRFLLCVQFFIVCSLEWKSWIIYFFIYLNFFILGEFHKWVLYLYCCYMSLPWLLLCSLKIHDLFFFTYYCYSDRQTHTRKYICTQLTQSLSVAHMLVCFQLTIWNCIIYHEAVYWRKLILFLLAAIICL